MTKRYVGTTLTYDVRAEVYLRTEVYESEDPGETVELRIIEPGSDKTPKSGAREKQRIKQQRNDPKPRRPTRPLASQQRSASTKTGAQSQPILLRPEDRKFERLPDGKPEARERRKTRIIPSQKAGSEATGRPKMVVSDRSQEPNSADSKTPPASARTLDGIPFARGDE